MRSNIVFLFFFVLRFFHSLFALMYQSIYILKRHCFLLFTFSLSSILLQDYMCKTTNIFSSPEISMNIISLKFWNIPEDLISILLLCKFWNFPNNWWKSLPQSSRTFYGNSVFLWHSHVLENSIIIHLWPLLSLIFWNKVDAPFLFKKFNINTGFGIIVIALFVSIFVSWVLK